MINIAEKEVLERYLREKQIIKPGEPCGILYCSGGVSGTVALLEREGTPMIIKQALGQLKTKDVWLCDPNRMYTEYESNRIYHELVPEGAPEVYFYDEENYIYGREAVPNGYPMWKEELLNGILDFQVAGKAIKTLVRVHNACSTREDIKEKFASKEIFYGLRISPYIQFTLEKHPELREKGDTLCEEMMEAKITLVHGDYSPKNIMVVNREVQVLDYEVAHFGHPAFDLAFFSNHFILKAVKYSRYPGAYLSMLRYMVDLYFQEMTCMEKRDFESVYVRVLAFLMLARIDGKSPVEYLTGDEKRRQLVREISIAMIQDKVECFKEAWSFIRNRLEREADGL